MPDGRESFLSNKEISPAILTDYRGNRCGMAGKRPFRQRSAVVNTGSEFPGLLSPLFSVTHPVPSPVPFYHFFMRQARENGPLMLPKGRRCAIVREAEKTDAKKENKK